MLPTLSVMSEVNGHRVHMVYCGPSEAGGTSPLCTNCSLSVKQCVIMLKKITLYPSAEKASLSSDHYRKCKGEGQVSLLPCFCLHIAHTGLEC